VSGERILVVEDEAAVARGIQYGLQAEGFDVHVAENGAKALELAKAKDPHAVLLDLRLPDISGFDVCRKLRGDGFTCPIIMVTARDEEVDKVLGLELGADDYIVKPFSLRGLVARVHAKLRRSYGELSASDSPPRIAFDDVEMDLGKLQVFRAGAPVFLTPTEFRLLRHLASKPNQTFSRDALIQAVWGYDNYVGDDRTIDVHIRHLREKIEANPSQPHRIVTVRGFGYKFSR
jgi:DNA-binding response OmpR family regulator